MPPDRVFLCRHATRIDLVDRDWRKTSPTPYDPPLAATGVRESVRLGGRIEQQLGGEGSESGTDPARVYIHSSPYLRCMQTALQLAQSFERKPTMRLEAWLGEWLTPDYFVDIQPPPVMSSVLDSARENLLNEDTSAVDLDMGYDAMACGDGGEYGEEWPSMHRRFEYGLRMCLSQMEERDTLILVTHGAGCNAILGAITSRPVLLDVALASLSEAVYRGPQSGYEVVSVASTAHLRTPTPSTPWHTPPLTPPATVNGVRRTVSTKESRFGLWKKSAPAAETSPTAKAGTWLAGKHGRRATLNS